MKTNLSKTAIKDKKLKPLKPIPASTKKPADRYLTGTHFIKVGGIEIY